MSKYDNVIPFKSREQLRKEKKIMKDENNNDFLKFLEENFVSLDEEENDE